MPKSKKLLHIGILNIPQSVYLAGSVFWFKHSIPLIWPFLGPYWTQNAVFGGKHAQIKKKIAHRYTKYTPKRIPSCQRFLIQAFYPPKMAVLGSVETPKCSFGGLTCPNKKKRLHICILNIPQNVYLGGSGFLIQAFYPPKMAVFGSVLDPKCSFWG